jgi:hypothetical protein
MKCRASAIMAGLRGEGEPGARGTRMNPKLRDLIDRMAAGGELNWLAYRKELSDLSTEMEAEVDRVALLGTYKALMDTVERQGDSTVADLPAFQKARLEEYRMFLIQEALDGTNVDPTKLKYVTDREVEAGRLAADDELRALAIAGPAGLAPSPPPPAKKSTWLGKLLGR